METWEICLPRACWPQGWGQSVHPLPSDAQQFISEGTVLKQSLMFSGIVGWLKQAWSRPPCHMAGAIILFSIPCLLCQPDGTHSSSVLVPIAVKAAGFACFPLLHSPMGAQKRPWGFSGSISLSQKCLLCSPGRGKGWL